MMVFKTVLIPLLITLLIGLVSMLSLAGCSREEPAQSDACNGAELDRVYLVKGNMLRFEEDSVAGSNGESFHLFLETEGDLNLDGQLEKVAVIERRTSGSEIYYYLAASALENCEYAALGSVYLGDRIGVDEVKVMPADHVDKGLIIAGLRFRGLDDSMAEPPSIYVTRMYRLNEGQLEDHPQY